MLRSDDQIGEPHFEGANGTAVLDIFHTALTGMETAYRIRMLIQYHWKLDRDDVTVVLGRSIWDLIPGTMEISVTGKDEFHVLVTEIRDGLTLESEIEVDYNPTYADMAKALREQTSTVDVPFLRAIAGFDSEGAA